MATTEGSPSQTKRICGMSRGIFFTVIGVIVALAIGLGVGLGVGLTRGDGDDKYEPPSCAEAHTNNESPRDINAVLTEIASENDLPALGALFVNDTSHVAVVGIRRIGSPINATTDDVWHLGSNTKGMTATTIGMLVQEGLLSWTATIGALLGGVIDVGEEFSNVTVQQLSSHTSGINDDPLIASNESYVASYELSAPEGRLLVSNFTLSSPRSGTQGVAEYSNMNYILLGLIIDVATNESAEAVIQSRIWEPLGISTGGWGPSPETSRESIDNPWPHVANGTLGKDGPPTPFPLGSILRDRDNPPCYNTAGAAHMSLADYGRWLRLHFDAGVQQQLNLSSEIMQELHSIAPGAELSSFTYGGWVRSDYGSGDTYALVSDRSNTYNYLTAAVVVGEGHAVGAVTNVAGLAMQGSTYFEATHEVRDGLLDERIVI